MVVIGRSIILNFVFFVSCFEISKLKIIEKYVFIGLLIFKIVCLFIKLIFFVLYIFVIVEDINIKIGDFNV